jgi:hypothetical protein
MSAATSCTFDHAPSNSELVDCVFGYSPSVPAAGLFIALFSLLLLVHLALTIRSRSLYSLWLVVCCASEIAGFAVRVAVIDSFTVSSFIGMTTLLIISPSLLALINYSLIGRITKMGSGIEPHTTPISSLSFPLSRLSLGVFLHPFLPNHRLNPDFVSRLFSLLAVLSVILQAVGISDLTSTSASSSTVTFGQHLLIGGLAVQLFTYCSFLIVCGYVHLSPHYSFSTSWPAMTKLSWLMGMTMTVLLMRGVYRLIQYATGVQSSISQHEEAFYTCDALLVLIVVVVFAALDVGRTTQIVEQEFEAKQKKPQSTQSSQPIEIVQSAAEP